MNELCTYTSPCTWGGLLTVLFAVVATLAATALVVITVRVVVYKLCGKYTVVEHWCDEVRDVLLPMIGIAILFLLVALMGSGVFKVIEMFI